MLIDLQQRGAECGLPSPVVGSVHTENVPTSGDVHLYADPQTYTGEYPLIYADCEGLEGGENLPVSAQYLGSPRIAHRKSIRATSQKKHPKMNKVVRGPPRDLIWADSPERSKRQFAVTNLYPRLLYTFSDVTVFVLRNPK
jgi:hypothetical protein